MASFISLAVAEAGKYAVSGLLRSAHCNRNLDMAASLQGGEMQKVLTTWTGRGGPSCVFDLSICPTSIISFDMSTLQPNLSST